MSNCYFNVRIRNFHVMWIRGNFIPGVFRNKFWQKHWRPFAVLDWPGKKN